MSSPPIFSLLFLSFLICFFSLSLSNPCDERCGPLRLPFPFHLNSSCGAPIPAFRLSCTDADDLYLPLGPTPLRVIAFLPSSASLLLDYSPGRHSNRSSPCDRWYSDFLDRSSPFLAVTTDNVLRLYDCEDSSVCRARCDEAIGDGDGAGCEGMSRGCCYPLADGSVWKAGDGFGEFREFGCRGFSSWVAVPSSSSLGDDGKKKKVKVERGIEMEWAVPRGYGNGTECAHGAVEVNATAVRGGVRCACGPGLVGDGFAAGSGCFKSCNNDGNTTYDGDCCRGWLCKKKVVVAVGLLILIFFISAATACYFLLRSPPKRHRRDPAQTCLPIFSTKACRTRHFTYQELNEATKRLNQEQKLVDIGDGTVHPGVLCDGSLVAVQRMRWETKENLNQVLDRVELLSHIAHKNITRIIGCCISSGHTLLLVHEFFPNGTLKDLLQPGRENGPLSWYRRINIATEIASALAHLQSDISEPIKPHNLKSSNIFILSDYSVKIASFKLLNIGPVLVSRDADVVYNFGLLLLELIMGSKHDDGVAEMVLARINDRRSHEIVDPCLRFGEQLPVQCEQIEKLAIFAVHCMSRRELCMVGAAKEFIRIVNDNVDGGSSLEPAASYIFELEPSSDDISIT